MKINKLDGSILFPCGAIQRAQDREHFHATPVGKVSKNTFVNDDWRHYEFDPEPGIAGTIFFKGERIDRVFLLMSIPIDEGKEWTEELELERKSKHDQWLKTELGEPPYEYAWGKVTSNYDVRACVSEIIVTYAD
jgi:hypothetical protein